MASTARQRVSLVELPSLCHFRWAIPALAELARGGGAKFVTLVHRTGAGRSAMTRTLAGLAAQDLVLPNPGYGHPMRPEWLLTPLGEALGPACVDAMTVLARLGVEDVAGRKWSLPVLAALAASDGPEAAFSDVLESLPDVTPRALTQTLRALEGTGLLTRRVQDAYPPRPRYRLTTRGQAVGQAALRLAEAASPTP